MDRAWLKTRLRLRFLYNLTARLGSDTTPLETATSELSVRQAKPSPTRRKCQSVITSRAVITYQPQDGMSRKYSRAQRVQGRWLEVSLALVT